MHDVETKSISEKAMAPRAHLNPAGPLPLIATLAGLTLLLIGLYLAILHINNGRFIYTLDDPYITLAVSDQIHHGNYGINAGAHASPASSIVAPFLLALLSGTQLHPYFPLILNSLALFSTAWILLSFFNHLRLVSDNFGVVIQTCAVFTILVCFNLVGVVFTGLEHSIHIALTAACVYGLSLFLDEDRLPLWFPIVVVALPTVRYEGLALSCVTILVLALRGRWRTAAICFVLIALALGGFSTFLVSLGLPPMPSSVLTKSAVASHGVSGAAIGLIRSFAANALQMTRDPAGAVLILIGVAAAVRFLIELFDKPTRFSSRGLMSLALALVIAGHSLAGQFGWFFRYEDYIVVAAAMMGIYIVQTRIRAVMETRKNRPLFVASAFVALMLFSARYLVATAEVPLAANNIYEQQYQMHRFVNEFWKAPVAVNDLGLVSYRNSNFVLDLGGLGSEEARVLRANKAGPEAYRSFVAGSGVHLVMIFDEWFPHQIPAEWRKLASMDLSRDAITPPYSEVQFYATDAPTADVLLPELRSFSATLPPRVKLKIYDAN